MRTAPLLRTVAGSIIANGAMNTPGTADWTSLRTAAGTYTVRFAPFRGLPIALQLTSVAWAVVGIAGVTSDSFSIQVWNTTTGAGADAGVYFTFQGRPL